MPKIKKLKGVTFQLVHRSQQDPLVADETAPQRVLMPVANSNKEKRLEEQHKWYYFDDSHNYLEHLKDPKDNRMEWPEHVEENLKKSQEAKIRLPSSVFASEKEEDVGMLNKAAPIAGPQLHLDPDLVAAMDEDFNYDDPNNQLEDDFVTLAQGVASADNDFVQAEDMDEVCSLGGSDQSFSKEESKSRLTNYSLTSSVMRRNEQLTLLDDRFQKMYETYDDSEIGALDMDEIEGHISESSDLVLKLAEEFHKGQQRRQLGEVGELGDDVKGRIKNEWTKSNREEMTYIPMEKKEKWDCQSILSTYSNLYNHPKLIINPPKQNKNKIKVDSSTGIPKNVLGANKLTIEGLNKFNQENPQCRDPGPNSVAGKCDARSVVSQLSALSIRSKDETPEAKRERKRALKYYRRERRLEKKLNSEAFKEERKQQVKIGINNRNNVQGNKLL